jgi:tRNA pseudouridine38-40 synthase
MRYFLRIQYHGGAYHGWQIQPDALSVQQVINESLSLILRRDIETTGCGRTDAGVHASDFFLHFDVNEGVLQDEKLLVGKLNSLKLKGILFVELFQVKPEAHARFSAYSRTYTYRIMKMRDPFLEGLAHYHHADLDINRMNEAGKLLIGEKDFSCFSKRQTNAKTNICRLDYIHWKEESEGIYIFTIKANRFLRNMVRAIVGTLLEVGEGKIQPEAITDILDSKSRSKAGISVAACGLFLTKIEYPEGIRL